MSDPKLRNFHEAKWDEPVIFEQSVPGSRSILFPDVSQKAMPVTGDVSDLIPDHLKRQKSPALPEMAQPQVLRHYLRLSQETIGQDINIDIGLGTCTMKYSPKINEQFVRSSKFTEMHPYQDDDTAQGILKIIYDFEQIMKEISGLDAVSFQAGGGGQGIYANAAVLKKYFEDKGEADQRTQIITTILSHPLDSAAPATKGFEVISLYPDENGYPDYEAFKAAVNEHTAAFFVANPEDTGVYNKNVLKFTKLVHEAGGLCAYDQANANGLLGVTRARDAGFDMCFFNLHKTFSTPHGCGGPACGATGVQKDLVKYLPSPLVGFDGQKYFFDYETASNACAVGKVREWYGVAEVVLKAYCWIRSLGPNGLYQVAKTAVLNNNYLFKKLMELPEVSAYYEDGHNQRIEQARYSLENLEKETGIGTLDIQRRMMDFGMHYWTSHHPFYLPEPMTLEPTETPSKKDIDEYIETLKYVFKEAHEDPETIKTAPHRSVTHQVDESEMDDPAKWVLSWKTYLKKCE